MKKQNIKVCEPHYRLDKKTKIFDVTWRPVPADAEIEIRKVGNLAKSMEINQIDEMI